MTDWNGDTRRDGVSISAPTGESYTLRHPDGTEVTACPCCTKAIWTPPAAQRIADYLWPLQPEAVPIAAAS